MKRWNFKRKIKAKMLTPKLEKVFAEIRCELSDVGNINHLYKVIYELARKARQAKCIDCFQPCTGSLKELTKCRNDCINEAEKAVKELEKENG